MLFNRLTNFSQCQFMEFRMISKWVILLDSQLSKLICHQNGYFTLNRRPSAYIVVLHSIMINFIHNNIFWTLLGSVRIWDLNITKARQIKTNVIFLYLYGHHLWSTVTIKCLQQRSSKCWHKTNKLWHSFVSFNWDDKRIFWFIFNCVFGFWTPILWFT